MNDWTSKWVAEKMKRHTEMRDVTLLSPQHVELIRKQYPTIVVGTTAVDRFDTSALTPFLDRQPNVSLRLGAKHGIPIGGLGDLMRAVSHPDVSQYVSKEVSFIERGLTQHTQVDTYERLDDPSYSQKLWNAGEKVAYLSG